MHTRFVHFLALLTLVLFFPANGVNAQSPNRPCPSGTGPGGITAGSYPPTTLSQDQRDWLFHIFGNSGSASVGYGGEQCGSQPPPQPSTRQCPSGTGPGGITAGSYPPTTLTQDQRDWLFHIFGNSGSASVGYGGENCQGHVPWSPQPPAQQQQPQPPQPPVQQQQVQPQPQQPAPQPQQPSQPQAPQPQPLPQLPVASAPSTVGPSGYLYCANEGQRCNFSDTKDVAYGANGQFSFKTEVSGGIDCNNGVFGDPNYGLAKACYIKDSVVLAQQPQVVFTVENATIASGQCTTLHWAVADAQSFSLDGSLLSDNPGSKEVCPVSTTTYTLHVVTNNGDILRLIMVTVSSSSAIPPEDGPIVLSGDDVSKSGMIIHAEAVLSVAMDSPRVYRVDSVTLRWRNYSPDNLWTIVAPSATIYCGFVDPVTKYQTNWDVHQYGPDHATIEDQVFSSPRVVFTPGDCGIKVATYINYGSVVGILGGLNSPGDLNLPLVNPQDQPQDFLDSAEVYLHIQ